MPFTPRPLAGLFVTGTDTGVGKTTLSRALLRLAYRRGQRVLPCKPAETGAMPAPADALALRQAAGADVPLELVCPYAFPVPAAPTVAAALASTSLSTQRLADACHRLSNTDPSRPLLVEGAGGLLTPISPRETYADLAYALGMPILLVARNSLGTINHTALALEALARRKLRLAGLVLVDTTIAPTPDRPYNASAIAALTGVTPLGLFPHRPAADDDLLASTLVSTVDCEPLLALLRPSRPA